MHKEVVDHVWVMNMKTALVRALKLAMLTVVYLICFILPTVIIPVSAALQQQMAATQESSPVLLFLLGLSLVTATALSYPVWHARIRGVRLMVALFVIMAGFLTVMGQIETFYFRSAFPLLSTAEIIGIVLRGLLTALLFVPVVVFTWRNVQREESPPPRVNWRSWAWKVPVLAVIYMVLYFGFGYYVAWQSPQLREFYTGSRDMLGIVDHYRANFSSSPFFAPLQFIRGFLWVGFATPLILALAGKRRETIVALCLLGGLSALGLLMPNPLFPDAVRYAHALETIPSTALFGALIGLFLGIPGPEKN